MSRHTLFVLWLAAGCTTSQTARPLPQGTQQVSFSFGGPIFEVPSSGGLTIPIPNMNLEYRRGIKPKLDVHMGTNLFTPIIGVLGLHGGATYGLLSQDGKRPALSVTDRLFLYSNHFDGRKEGVQALWPVNELELNVSWKHGDHLYYVNVVNNIDFLLPRLLLSPGVGADFKLGSWQLGPHLRWYAPYEDTTLAVLTYPAPGKRGAIGVGFTLGRRFGGQ